MMMFKKKLFDPDPVNIRPNLNPAHDLLNVSSCKLRLFINDYLHIPPFCWSFRRTVRPCMSHMHIVVRIYRSLWSYFFIIGLSRTSSVYRNFQRRTTRATTTTTVSKCWRSRRAWRSVSAANWREPRTWVRAANAGGAALPWR